MTGRHIFLSIAFGCLLAACGRVGDDSRLPVPASLERQPVSQQPAQASAPVQAETPPQASRSPLPPPEALTDPAISARIESAMKADPEMSGADVSINTDKGVVVLSGTVKSHEQTGIASAHAQRQDGVLRVDNHLKPEFS